MNRIKAGSQLAALVVLLVQACAAPAPTTAPTNTAAPTATDTAAPTETATPANAAGYEIVMEYEGEWSGAWQNTTFGSSGDVVATVIVNNDGTMELILDLGGLVFGVIDPPAITFEGAYTANGATLGLVDDATFGTIALILSVDGEINGSFENVMLTSGTISVTGNHSPEHIELSYTMAFEGARAEGTLVMDHE